MNINKDSALTYTNQIKFHNICSGSLTGTDSRDFDLALDTVNQ
jgi:hypothetical protein